MPVIGTPVTAPSSTDTQCSGLGIVRPRLTTVEGQAVPSRLQGVAVSQGQAATIEFTLRDEAGDAIDLTSCDFPGDDGSSASADSDDSNIKVALREALSFDNGQPSLVVSGSPYPQAGNGVVRFELPAAVTALPGVEVAEVGLFRADGSLLYSANLYVLVNRGQFGSQIGPGGLPTLKEIRLRLKASDAADSYLLDNVEWDDAEIADAIVQTVALWNESQPPIKQRYNTATFPYTYESFGGIAGKLYQAAAYYYFREDLQYQAAGVTVADKNKGPVYQKLGEAMWQKWETWVKRKKASINLTNGSGSFLSPYAWGWRR